MDKDISNNQRIAKNALMLYIRMFILMFVNLFTSRIVLHALGVEDYGIYNAVCGFIAMFSMVSTTLSTSISRFLTYAIGARDDVKINRIFSSSIIIQIIIAGIIVIFVEAIGVWFLNTKMTIPEVRLSAANFILQFSLISFVFNLLSIPYNALIIANEKMNAFAYIGIFEGLASLLVAYTVTISPIDKLVTYGCLTTLVAVCVRLLYTSYCKKHFEDCHFYWCFDKHLIIEMFKFAGWNFFGSFSSILRSQGLNILFNIYNGPVVNAARALTVQVNAAVSKFSNSFYTAVQPQITKLYAAGDIKESSLLVCRSTRLAFCLLLIICYPLIFGTEFILSIWLHEIPDHTIIFVKIILINCLIESFSSPLIHLMLATGNIKWYQIVVGGINLLNFPIAWIILDCGKSPEYAQISVILISILALIARLFMLNRMIDFPISFFLKESLLKCILVSLLAVIVPLISNMLINNDIHKFLITTFLVEINTCFLTYIIILSKNERQFVQLKLKETMYKITH